MSIGTLLQRLGLASQSPLPIEEPTGPAKLEIENGHLLNLGNGPALNIRVVVDDQLVAELAELRPGFQWDRQIDPGAAVRWLDADGAERASQD